MTAYIYATMRFGFYVKIEKLESQDNAFDQN
jgi:hypothetical protein